MQKHGIFAGNKPMSARPQIVTIFGGSGFVGRYIARRMAKEGWRVRVAVRRPNEAIFVRPYGVVGQVEPILANIRDDASVQSAIQGADVVINCVGILAEDSRQKFDAVQADGAERIARFAKSEGVERLVHISAIGADAKSDSDYARTKAQGEAAIKKHFKSAVILRPSIIFGPEDQFFNRFAQMAKFSPIIPMVGADTKFQPVYVDDVAQAAVVAAIGKAKSGTYELGGPDTETFAELMDRMLKIVRRSRFKIEIPFFAASILGRVLSIVEAMTFGLVKNNQITVDQVRLLRHDNVVAPSAKGFRDLKIQPMAMDAILDEYLYAHRPYGQFTELTESSKNLS